MMAWFSFYSFFSNVYHNYQTHCRHTHTYIYNNNHNDNNNIINNNNNVHAEHVGEMYMKMLGNLGRHVET